MVWKVEWVKQGDLYEDETRIGVRASIVALKRRNGRGAKGGRKVDALQRARHGTQTGIHWYKPRSLETPRLLSGRTNRVTSWNRVPATTVMGVKPFVFRRLWMFSP